MISARERQKVTRVVEILSRAEETLEKLHHYYKFARHAGALLDEVYFWCAHSAHLVYAVRQTEEKGLSGMAEGNPHFASLVAGLDFTPFHYLDYRRRIFYWNAYQDYLRVEPRWFRLWMKILEESEYSSASDLEEFSRLMAIRVGNGRQADRRIIVKNDPLVRLMQTGSGGHIIVSSMRVLADMVSALASFVAKVDPASHGLVQIQSLACLLSRMRHVIVWDGAAEGPYALRNNRAWGLPSTLASWCFWRAPGLLRITPKDEGGEVACVYTWNKGSKTWQRAWTRSVATQGQEYEDNLFETWSYDDGQWAHSTGDQATKACWVIAESEATYLESICQHADAIAVALKVDPTYGPIAEEAGRVLRAGENTWAARSVAWTHVKDLDLLIGKLKRLCRQAQTADGANEAAPRGTGDQGTYSSLIADFMWQQPGTESTQKPAGGLPVDGQEPGYESAIGFGQADQAAQGVQARQWKPVCIRPPVNLSEELTTLGVTQEFQDDSCQDAGGTTKSHDESSSDKPVAPPTESGHGDQAAEPEIVHDDVSSSEPQATVVSEKPKSRKPAHRSKGDKSAPKQVVEVQASCPSDGTESHEPEAAPAEPAPQHPAQPAEAQATALPEEITSNTDSSQRIDSVAEPATSEPSPAQPDPVETKPEAAPCDSSSAPEPSGAVETPQADGQTAPARREKAVRAKKRTVPDGESDDAAVLVQKLVEHHRESSGEAGRKPLSSKQLQQELRWGQSKVQSAMTALFGEKPFIRYTEKCKEGTILAFLHAPAAATEPPARPSAPDQPPANETATKPADKRGRSRGRAPVVRTRRGSKAQGPESGTSH